ncbi:MAG: DUF2304 domain-containing protein [bacterium]
MDQRIQIVAILAAFALAILILELVRRRRLNERYALLWLFSALIILILAVWEGLLARIASLLGIAYPPNALFLIAVGFILLLLLSMSTSLSRLQGQTRVLAQRLAILEARFRDAQGESGRGAPEATQDPVDEDDKLTG